MSLHRRCYRAYVLCTVAEKASSNKRLHWIWNYDTQQQELKTETERYYSVTTPLCARFGAGSSNFNYISLNGTRVPSIKLVKVVQHMMYIYIYIVGGPVKIIRLWYTVERFYCLYYSTTRSKVNPCVADCLNCHTSNPLTYVWIGWNNGFLSKNWVLFEANVYTCCLIPYGFIMHFIFL